MELEHSKELDQLGKDLSQLQGELPHVSKDSKGYGYNYSSLPDTLDVAKPLLQKYGFAISQFEDGQKNLVTLLLHKSGQWIKGRMSLIEIEMKGTNAAQNKGSVLSYFRRYSIQAILGLAAEDSDGATKGSGDKASATPLRPQSSISNSTSKAAEVKTETSAPAVVTEGIGPAIPAKKSFRKI